MKGIECDGLWKEFHENFPKIHKVFFGKLLKGIIRDQGNKKDAVSLTKETADIFRVLVFNLETEKEMMEAVKEIGFKWEAAIRSVFKGIQRRNPKTGKWGKITKK